MREKKCMHIYKTKMLTPTSVHFSITPTFCKHKKVSFYNIPFTYIPKKIIGFSLCAIERIGRLRGDKVSFASKNQSPQPILTLS
jgi:hypothetical protein